MCVCERLCVSVCMCEIMCVCVSVSMLENRKDVRRAIRKDG